MLFGSVLGAERICVGGARPCAYMQFNISAIAIG